MPKSLTIDGLVKFHGRIDSALRNCQKKGCRPLFMPELVDVLLSADFDSKVDVDSKPMPEWDKYDKDTILYELGEWKLWEWDGYVTPSAMISGIAPDKKAVTVFAHVPNYLSNHPRKVVNAINREGERRIGFGAIRVPDDEFQRLLDIDGKEGVFVIDHESAYRTGTELENIQRLLKHPGTTPFFGSESRAKAFFRRARRYSRTALNHVWYHSENEFQSGPIGYLLAISPHPGNTYGPEIDVYNARNNLPGDDFCFVLGKKS